jgi:4-carboxymuconolactone decarboxylase
MKQKIVALTLAMAMAVPAYAQNGNVSSGTSEALRAVAPALEGYANDTVFGALWQRPELSARDRSIVTIAALIARNQPLELAAQLERALDNGVTPAEISGVVTHLAFYSGWGNAVAAAPTIKAVFDARGIDPAVLRAAEATALPFDEEGDAARAASVAQTMAGAAPGLEHFTTDLLFRDLWLRPDLAARDRSLVTISSLISLGQTAQLAGHLNRGMDNGLTATEAGEIVAHLAFYAGWPNAFSAGPIVRDVLESRRS